LNPWLPVNLSGSQSLVSRAAARHSRPLLAKAAAGDEEDEMSTKKTMQRDVFKPGEFIVYPAHGVGQVTAIEEQEIAGFKLELFVVSFAKEKMTLRVPVAKVVSVGMRKLSEASAVAKALEVLTGRARIKRTMWSRRAQEYEAKINSGDIIAVAEVVRDLYRSEAQPEQSYSERQLFETALARLVDEVAAVDGSTETEALKRVESSLAKGPRRARATDAAEPEADNDENSEEAA
jgi:CarD family transcriptional regulator